MADMPSASLTESSRSATVSPGATPPSVSSAAQTPSTIPPYSTVTPGSRARIELARARDIEIDGLAAVLGGAFVGWLGIFLKSMVNEAIGGDTGYILLVPAIILAAWLGGVMGGLAATAVTFVLNSAIYIDPGQIIAADRVEIARQFIFIVAAVGSTFLIASRRASRDRLATALDEVATLADGIESRDRRLELMLSASGTGFWEWDIVTGELSWSAAIFRQHGLEPADHAPAFNDYLSMIHPDDRARFQSAVSDAVAGGPPMDLEFRLVWPDGTIHWTRGSGRVFGDADGTPIRMIGTGQDITERRVIEDERDRLLIEERRAGEFREAFVDVISHELRTPITTILGTTELLSRPGRVDDPVVRAAMLTDVRAESERLHRLVEDLLVLSRVERGRLVVDAEPLQLSRLLGLVVAHEAEELPSIHVRLVLPAALPVVSGEATYVEQIVRNLLENAAKYAPADTDVVVSAERVDDDVVIRVSDDGPGIPRASREHIFDLFYRDPETARSVAGSGIGLFVCRNLVEAMGGTMTVDASPSGGAEFAFSLPILSSDDEDTPQS